MKVNVFLRSYGSPLGDNLGLQCLLGKKVTQFRKQSVFFFLFKKLILVDDNELFVATLMDLSGCLLVCA